MGKFIGGLVVGAALIMGWGAYLASKEAKEKADSKDRQEKPE